jgi:hypothetical protein
MMDGGKMGNDLMQLMNIDINCVFPPRKVHGDARDGRDARYLSLLKAAGGTWPAAKAEAEAELKHLPPIHGSIHP